MFVVKSRSFVPIITSLKSSAVVFSWPMVVG